VKVRKILRSAAPAVPPGNHSDYYTREEYDTQKHRPTERRSPRSDERGSPFGGVRRTPIRPEKRPMHRDELHTAARSRAAELPGTGAEYPFGPEWEVYKVRGRMFMALYERGGDPAVNLKARPADSEVLRTVYPQIAPGYHMNKRHWITVTPGTALDAEMFSDLVTESYLLVVEQLPRGQRPVDPETFGQTQAEHRGDRT
jgi:predicted DNA-binding protein (MmcQ/YjbR family)